MEMLLTALIVELVSFLVAKKINDSYLDMKFNARLFSEKYNMDFDYETEGWKYIPIYNIYYAVQNFLTIKHEYEQAGMNPFDKLELLELALLKERKREQEEKPLQRTGSHEFTQKFGEIEEKWIEMKPNIDSIQIEAGTLNLYLGLCSFKTNDIVYLPESKFMDYSYEQNKLKLTQISPYDKTPVEVYIVVQQDKRYHLELNTNSYQFMYQENQKHEFEQIDIDTLQEKQKTFQIK